MDKIYIVRAKWLEKGDVHISDGGNYIMVPFEAKIVVKEAMLNE